MAALPTELIIEILSRLPVKSLVCFKTVRKFWNDLINTPNFIKLHLDRTLISNSDRHLLRWSDDSSLYSAKIDLDLHPNDLYFSKLNLPFETQNQISVVGSCNGVVCITDSSKNDVFLYNPLTNSHRKLPGNEILNPNYYRDVIYGFGYDSKNDDYKVLKICPWSSLATVYSLKNNTWRSVEGIQMQIHDIFDCDKGVLVNEALHYTVCIKKSDPNSYSYSYRIYIYSFDLGTESFSIMDPHIPDYEFRSKFIPVNKNYRYSDILVRSDLFLRELGGCLCIVVDYNYVPEVWVMKEYGNKESWTNLFCFNNPWKITLVRRGFFEPIVYSKGRDGRRRCLVKISSSELAWHDLDTEKATKLISHDDHPKLSALDKLFFHDVHPKYFLDFVGTLVSLN